MTDKNKKNKELNVLLKAAGILETDDEKEDEDSDLEDQQQPKKYRHSKFSKSSKDRANRQIQWDYHMLHLPRGKIPGVDKSQARKEAAERLDLPTKPPSDWHYDPNQVARVAQPSRKSKVSRIRTSAPKIKPQSKKYKHNKSSKDRANRQIQWDYHMLHLPRGKISGIDKSQARKEAAERLNLPTKPPSDWHYDPNQVARVAQPSRNSKVSRIRTSEQKAKKDEYNRQLQWDLHVLGIPPGKVPGMKRTKARQLAAQRLGKEEYAPVGWKFNSDSKRSQKRTFPEIHLPLVTEPSPTQPQVVMREIPLAPPRVFSNFPNPAVIPLKSKRNQKVQKDAYNRQLQWDLHVLGIPAGRVPNPGRSVARRVAAERLQVSEHPPSNWKYIPARYK